jgi:putative ABC transport system permease protein
MVKNYFKTAWRNLLRNKIFSLTNILGLAIGTLCCVYIVLYVSDQYSYDAHFKDAKNIYRLNSYMKTKGDLHKMATASPPIAPAMKKDFPEVQEFTRVVPTLGSSKHLLRYKEKSFYEQDAYLVDSTFFDVFDWHFTKGNAENFKSATNAIALMKPVADKLFGDEDPVGKVITMEDADGTNYFTVTGVIDDHAGETNIQANMFIKMQTNGYGSFVLNSTNWVGNNFTNSYVKLRPGTDAKALEKKLSGFLIGYSGDELKNKGMEKQLHLQPITRIHTTSGLDAESVKTVSKMFLYILLLIAILIQLIACINFMNLSTAQASRRAKEVGVRKVIGAGKSNLIMQFLGESFLLTILSVLIALPVLVLLFPYLNEITHTHIQWSSVFDYKILLLLACIIIVTGLAAGSYPALYLSAFKEINVLKGAFANQISAAGIRRALVVFQFVISITLIVGIIVIYSQLNYIKTKDLGFNKEQKIVFHFYTPASRSKLEVFANGLKQVSKIKNITVTNNIPGAGPYYDWSVFLQGGGDATGIDQQNLSADENFVKTMGMKIISGRNFYHGDSSRVLINETLMNRLGLQAANAPGAKLYSADNGPTFEIAGVVKDFNYQSLRDDVHPFMIIYDPKGSDISNIIINANSDNYAKLISNMETIWHQDLPAEPFQFSFLDATIQKQYETEITQSNIANLFTLMAIFISCLGLFGLAAFSAEQRSKEIGVRKVLGASVGGIVQLLSKDFLKLVSVSFIIASPIAWWAMNKWLQNFAYKIHISWWMFVIAGFVTLLIALITVSFQAIKAAIANPVKSLRTE